MTDLRDRIAEVLAGHARYELAPGPIGPEMQCKCGHFLDFNKSANQIAADWRAHVAEVILAAIGDRVLPEGAYIEPQWRAAYRDGGDGLVTWSVNGSEELARQSLEQARSRGWPGAWLEHRTVHRGPWLPVDTEDPRPALTEGRGDG